jgi:hypothetical protein
MRWAVSNPRKRNALAQPGHSEGITPTSRAEGHKTMARIGELLERSRATGPMRDVPMGFAIGIMKSVAEATVDLWSRTQPMRTNTAKSGSMRCGA